MNWKNMRFAGYLPRELECKALQTEIRPCKAKVLGQKLGSITPYFFGKFNEMKKVNLKRKCKVNKALGKSRDEINGRRNCYG